MTSNATTTRRKGAKPFILATAGLAGLVGILWLVVYFGAPVTAPDVVGDSLEDAAAKLDDAGISVDTDGAKGTVTAQHPLGGEKWYRNQDFVITYTNESGTHTIGG